MGHKPKVTPKKAEALRALADEDTMSDREALEEAQRRWGASGQAWHPCYWRKGQLRYCQVGAMVGEVREEWQIFGTGRTWREAFLDSELRGH